MKVVIKNSVKLTLYDNCEKEVVFKHQIIIKILIIAQETIKISIAIDG